MFCLSGQGAVLHNSVFPPIDLAGGGWELGLVDFTTYNSIPNVEDGVNNLFHYGDQVVTLPTGSYEIDDIAKYVVDKAADSDRLRIRGNNNTFKVEVYSRVRTVDFSRACSVGPLLGFAPKVLTPGVWHTSDRPVDIIKVNVVRVECNLVRGSYQNGSEGHVIHEFYPAVPPGFKIVEKPQNVIYLPVNAKRLEHITVSFRDQNNRPINFRDEVVNVRLHLRQRDRPAV